MSVLWSDEHGSWERRQKPGMFPTGKQALWFMAKLVFWAGVVWLFVILGLSL